MTKQNLLMSRPLKDAEMDLQTSIESCLLPEQEIIREGSKKLLQIHSEFLIQKYPPIQHFNESVQDCETSKKDDKYFSKTFCMVQKEKLKEEECSLSLPDSTKLIDTDIRDSHVGTIEKAQQPYESAVSGQHTLHFNSLTKSIAIEASPTNDIHKQSCFPYLNFTNKSSKGLSVSNPNILTNFEKKTSASGSTMSLVVDQGSSTKSINGSDEFIQDVTSANKIMKFDDLDMAKASHFDVLQNSKGTGTEKPIEKPIVCIAKARDFIHMPQQVEMVSPQLEATKSSKNQKPDSINKINDCHIESSIEYKPKNIKNPFSHVPKDNHVEFSNEIHEAGTCWNFFFEC